MRWRIGETFKLPFFRHLYLSIKIDEGKFAMPPDWHERALKMMTGRIPADADFLARAWFYENMQKLKIMHERNAEIRLLQRKLTEQKREIRRLLTDKLAARAAAVQASLTPDEKEARLRKCAENLAQLDD